MALAQHYGMPTGYVDLTEALEIAVFFATCQFVEGSWVPREHGTGILYRLPLQMADDAIRDRATAIGLQPFARPRQQWAWTFEMILGEDVEDIPGLEAVEFEHNQSVGEQVLALLNGGESVLPLDPIADWADVVRQSADLPEDIAAYMVSDLSQDPYGIDQTDADRLLSEIEAECQVRFASKVREVCAPEILADLERQWNSDKAKFTSDTAPYTHFRLVRSRKDSIGSP